MTLAVKWGRAIKAQRRTIGITQRELAERIGVSLRTVSSWEQGEKCPTPRNQQAVGRALLCDPRMLFTYPQEWVA